MTGPAHRTPAADALPMWRKSLIPVPGATCDHCGELVTWVVNIDTSAGGEDNFEVCADRARAWSHTRDSEFGRRNYQSVDPYMELIDGTWYIANGWPPDIP